GEGIAQGSPERCTGPIGGRGIALEERIPVRQAAPHCRTPRSHMLRMLQEFRGVVAGLAEQTLQCELQRAGTCACHTGADHSQGHCTRFLSAKSGSGVRTSQSKFAKTTSSPGSNAYPLPNTSDGITVNVAASSTMSKQPPFPQLQTPAASVY